MHKRFLFIGVLFLLLGCGRAPTLEEKEEFTPYLNRFLAYSKQNGRDLSASVNVTYGNLQGKHLGVCEEAWLQTPHVEINRAAWGASPESTKEMMLFHELGHCLLGRSHIDTKVSAGPSLIPSSIMGSHGVPGRLYEQFQDYYLTELFNRS